MREPIPPRACSTCISRRAAPLPGSTRPGVSTSARARRRRSSQSKRSATRSDCARDVHVFTERVGGGFGGKQEMLSEDLCVLGTLKTGRPVQWEFTREEQFIGATTRHQTTSQVLLGARRDGTLTAIAVRVVSNTGAMVATPVRRSRRRSAARWRPIAARGRLRRLHQPAAGRGGSAATVPRRPLSPSSARSTIWRKNSALIRSRCAPAT